MLLIKINKHPIEKQKSKNGWLLRKQKKSSFKREKLLIGNKVFYVVELNENQLETDEFKLLLNAFKGRILFEEGFESINFKDYLFDPSAYNIRALLSSFLKLLNNEVPDKRNVFVDANSFFFCDELFELVKASKKTVFNFKDNLGFRDFSEECYYSFGAIVKEALLGSDSWNFDYFLKLYPDEKSGECVAYVDGYKKMIYPDEAYFKVNDSIKLLESYGVSLKIASAVINT